MNLTCIDCNIKNAEFLIQKSFQVVDAFDKIAHLRKSFSFFNYFVVMNNSEYFGLFSPDDAVFANQILIGDCVRERTKIKITDNIDKVFDVFEKSSFNELPVFNDYNFIGVICRNDLLTYLKNINKLLQTEIDKQTKLLKESLDVKNQLIAIISHDLRSPFNSIIGFSNLLINNLEKYPINKVEEFLKIINTTSKHTFFLLENLLQWAKISEKNTSNFQLINLFQLTEEIILFLEYLHKDKNLSFNIKIDKNITINCSEEITKTILRNFLSNAIKFSYDSGLIEIETSLLKDKVEIKISDNGIGISDEKINSLFEDSGYSNPGTNNEKGIGFGLSLCKKLVENQGGVISCESKIGIGSTFTFTIPV